MKFNHFLSAYYPDTSYGGERLYADMLEQARLADRLGYDAVSVPEHHLINILLTPAPLMMAVKIAAETRNVDIVTSVAVLPIHDMRTYAGEVVMADILTEGRLVLGVGRGAFGYEMARLGTPLEDSREKFDESLDVLQALLSEEEVSWDGKYYKFDPITIQPRPMSTPMPGMMIAALAPEAIYHCARRGLHVQTTPLQGNHDLLLQQVDAFKRGKAELGAAGEHLRLSLLRGVAEVATAYFFLNALFNMPLANVTAVLQSAPLSVMLAAALVLREPIGWRRISAALIGFCGVLMIVRPGPDGFNIYALYTLIAVACLTVRDIATRKLSKEAPTLLVTAVTSGMIFVFFGGLSLIEGWVPLDGSSGWLIGGATLMVLGAYLASVQAMRVGEVSFVSPFRYTALLLGLLLGFAVFGDWPTDLTLLGAAIVVGSGLYSFWRESLRGGRRRVV